MRSRQDLERRVRELEARLAQSGVPAHRGVRYESAFRVLGLPLVAVATGPDSAAGEFRGHARGIIAIGDIATGVFALGGLARGIVALGGLAIGVVTFGGASFGALVAFGGLAIGGAAMGGAAIGWTAVGGAAAGTYACGGGAVGEHVISAGRFDPEAAAHFERYGLTFLCRADRQRKRAA